MEDQEQERKDDLDEEVGINMTEQKQLTKPNVKKQMSLASYSQLQESIGLTWKNLTYTVKDNKNKNQQKTILSDISGFVEPGKVLCILGPSGSGKTTLLQILSGLRSQSSGCIYYLGKEKTETTISDDIMGYSGNAAYIAQEDHLMGSLTVRESLQFSAELKVKASSTDGSLVENTLKYLGLTNCADTIVGNPFFKGISGGQKRRVSIGIELMGQPSLLFMDEVTSGLDSTSAYNIMELINGLAKKGHSIIMTIHQPTTRMFNLMSQNDFSMMVLESGRTMYFGKVSNVVPYLQDKIGHQIDQFTNPCDELLDLVNTDFSVDETADADRLYNYFNENEKDGVMKDIDTINDLQEKLGNRVVAKTGNNICIQMWVLLKRNFKNNLRNPAVYWVRIVMYGMLCFCLGTLYWEIGSSIEAQQDRISILFFVAAFLTFMSISGMPAFVEERAIYLRERTNNHYSTLSYCVSNFLSSLPWIFLIALISSALIYSMIQSRLGGEKFAIYLANLFVALMVAESMMVMISAISSLFMVGLAMGAGMLGLYMIVCGFFLLPKNIPDGWIWVHYGVSFHTYSFQVFMYNEFNDFKKGDIDGNAVLKFYDMEDTNIPFCFLILCIMMAVYRIIFYVLLRFLNRKQK